MSTKTKWAGTALCLIGIALTAFNVYPANLFFGLAGSYLWMRAGYVADDPPLVLVEFAAVVMYFAGVINWLFV